MMIRKFKAVLLFAGLALVGCGGTIQAEYQNVQVSQNADGSFQVTDGEQSESVKQIDLGSNPSDVTSTAVPPYETWCCDSCSCGPDWCFCSGCTRGAC